MGARGSPRHRAEAAPAVRRPFPPARRPPMVRSPGLLLSLAALVLALDPSALARPAAGHAVLQRAEPGAESRVRRAPNEVRLYFTERLEPAYSTVRVVDDHGRQVDRRDSRVERANPALLRVTLPQLPVGTYLVKWRVLSIDADVTEGEFTFRIE